MKFFHIIFGLLIGRIGFPFLFQKIGVFLPERFDRGELFDSQLVKMILCRLVQQNFSFMFCSEFFAVPGFAIFYIDSPRISVILFPAASNRELSAAKYR